ncbi:hypothetical protein LENED_002308 [Lentinula edodes]|uniref:Uncharacterized protein n=1 Tax=Lentinula edodes TaxID=5353 RepID=A0A1Q3E0H6_LENED|nr:hypothetical protein LENED_002308 [Lentinula edodes]
MLPNVITYVPVTTQISPSNNPESIPLISAHTTQSYRLSILLSGIFNEYLLRIYFLQSQSYRKNQDNKSCSEVSQVLTAPDPLLTLR